MQLWDDPSASVSAAAVAASASASAPAKDDPSHPSNVYLSAYTQPNGLANGGTSSQHYSSQQQLHYQQQQALLQMQQQQQQKSLQAQSSNSLANQVVNVVSVEQGTKGYSQLQDQMQQERRLQQDTME
ncbi:hypothetical protein GGI22_006239, partial [Coemansia erecta]